MSVINLNHSTKKILLFAVALLYLVGPVIRVFHAYVSDLVFLAVFILLILSGTKLQFNSQLAKIFFIPIIIVSVCTIGKFFWGYSLGMDEAANTLNYVKLFLLFVLVYSVFILNQSSEEFKKDLKVLNYIVIFFILFICSIGLLQFANHPSADFIIKNFYHVIHKTGTDNIYEFQLLNRVTSIFDSFNGMGIVLCFTLFILVFINEELKNYWSILFFLLGLTLIFLTGNRASLIILFLMTVIYLVYIKRGINLKIFSIIAGLFLASGVIFFLIANYLSFDNYIRFYEFKLLLQNGSIPPTLQVRLDKWQWLPVHMASVSQGIFGYTTNDFLKEKIYTSPDNQYLNWLVYYGYAGALAFIAWIIYSSMKFRSVEKTSAGKSNFYIKSTSFTIIYWTGLIVIGFFQESFFFGRLRELFIFLLGIISAYYMFESKQINKSNSLQDV